MHWIKYRVTKKTPGNLIHFSVHFKTLISYKNGYFCRAYLVHVFYFLNFLYAVACWIHKFTSLDLLYSYIASCTAYLTWHDGAWIQITFFGGALKSIYCFKSQLPLSFKPLWAWLLYWKRDLFSLEQICFTIITQAHIYVLYLVENYDVKKKSF